jgi:hypothetical protein
MSVEEEEAVSQCQVGATEQGKVQGGEDKETQYGGCRLAAREHTVE